jgi:hypothetical protein
MFSFSQKNIVRFSEFFKGFVSPLEETVFYYILLLETAWTVLEFQSDPEKLDRAIQCIHYKVTLV